MPKRLTKYLNSAYVEATNVLKGKRARRRIVAYVESYDDVFFWSHVLRPLETEHFYFEVMLPSRNALTRGKKEALAQSLGPYMIACVDADYDYAMQGATATSERVCRSEFVFHTYAYAIENYECYAPTLQNVCVAATLNDRRLFDFESFLQNFSRIVWPLLVWNLWCYRYGEHRHFTMQHFCDIVAFTEMNYQHPEETLEKLKHRVNAKIGRLQRQFPEGQKTYKPFMNELVQQLGFNPDTAYLYMRGHDLQDAVVLPIMGDICDMLRREREREIRRLACHNVQMQNELSSYQHSAAPVAEMLRKQTGYDTAPTYLRIREDIGRHLHKLEAALTPPTAAPNPSAP